MRLYFPRQLITLCFIVVSISAYPQPWFDPNDVEVEGDLAGFTLQKNIVSPEKDVYLLKLELTAHQPRVIPGFTVKWHMASQEIYTIWDNRFNSGRSNYNLTMHTRTGAHLALLSYIDKGDHNRMTFGISDNLNTLVIQNRLSEEDAHFYVTIDFFKNNPPKKHVDRYSVDIRFDLRKTRYEKALADMSRWWRQYYPPAHVPVEALVPYYSTWYNFHHQLSEEELVKECQLAKTLGMEGIIIDAGWMTLDDAITFSTVGDYKPERLTGIKNLVEQVQAMGMKVMLWYSISMAGIHSEAAVTFKGKFIRKENMTHIYDPRYPGVREHLTGILEKAMKEWGLDGFKLDFMSKMYPGETTPDDSSGGRDFASIDEATAHWLKEIYRRLSTINPNVLIEFRQPHINPVTQQYANMYRAIDNFNMEIANRIYISKLRLASPGLATHSDMLKWHKGETVEDAALQLLNGIFSVPQVSVKLDSIPKHHLKMIKFWLGYWNENKALIMHENFYADNPGENYTSLHTFHKESQVSALYATQVVTPKHASVRKVDIINATGKTDLYFDPGEYLGETLEIKVFDSMGQEMSSKTINNTRTPVKIKSPMVGLIRVLSR